MGDGSSGVDPIKHLHVVGDSISMHYGVHLEKMLQGVLSYSRKPPQNSDPESANGRDSVCVVEYLQTVRHTLRCDYLLVNCGLHDLKRNIQTHDLQVPLAAYAANLETIITLAKELGSELIWVRTTPVIDQIHNALSTEFRRHAADVADYNAQADATMKQHHLRSIDLFTFTQKLGGAEIYLDHVHFTDGVRQQQAAFITGYLYHDQRI